ncbi:MAG: CPBP family intramembrane metalloprotease [Bacteroidia bacterium]|nr:CPBP family intramembrane metalloprotease [Bacteroidia bacterium]
MKKFIGYIIRFVKEELDWKYLLFLVLFLGAAIYWAYPEAKPYVFRGKRSNWLSEFGYFGYHFILYGIPFFTAYGGYIVFKKRFDLLTNWRFWALSVFAVSIFAYRGLAGIHADLISESWTINEFPNFWRRLFRDLFRMAAAMVPVTVFWLLFDQRSTIVGEEVATNKRFSSSPYGFTLKNFNLKPYFGMLAIMLPFVIGFGLTDHFGGYYPRGLKNLQYYFGMGVDPPQNLLLLFEFVYGLDFISIEYFFRGFLVIAFIRFVGPGAILPMAAFYVFIHFGKPMVETISSFFGGSLLGILTYYSRSIWGGIVVHMGIAWLMELGAYMGSLSSS